MKVILAPVHNILIVKFQLPFVSMSQSHILTMMEAGVIAGKVKGDPFENNVRVTLDDKELWEKFRALTNEMIVTKTGR